MSYMDDPKPTEAGNADEITDKMRKGAEAADGPRTDRGRSGRRSRSEEKSITLTLYLLYCCQSLNLADYNVRTYDI